MVDNTSGQPTESVGSDQEGREARLGPGDLVRQTTIDEDIFDEDARKRNNWDQDGRGAVLVELNLRYAGGLVPVQRRLRHLFDEEFGSSPEISKPQPVAQTYFRCVLTVEEIQRLVRRDQFDGTVERPRKERAIYHVWLDYVVRPFLDRSVSTVKADAARRSYAAAGSGVTWAVIDSGIDASHPHFATNNTLDATLGADGAIDENGELFKYHVDLTAKAPDPEKDPIGNAASALTDPFGHGSLVAGIIAGALPEDWRQRDPPPAFRIGQHRALSDFTDPETTTDIESIQERTLGDDATLSGVAPQCKLISLRVLDSDGQGRSSDVMRALYHVRVNLNGEGKVPVVHGVNISLGYDFNAKAFACGQSPLCVEVDRVVRSGVVVVVAAGNTGFGKLPSRYGPRDSGIALTINDPGNSMLAITVGSTHRDRPHTFGVSYFSSKGPTADGRLKPDLVAPGERITSCAAGRNRDELLRALAIQDGASGAYLYIDDSGTSFAAPHVSGAVAAFLSIRDEYIGQPEEVKRLFLENATSLGRERYFEGHGLVDLMRAIQAV
jgi:serine protease AprX